MANLNEKMNLAKSIFEKPQPSETLKRVTAQAVSDSTAGSVSVQFEDGSIVEIPTIAPVESGQTVNVMIGSGKAVSLGASGWGDEVNANAASAAAATAYITHIESGIDAGLHVHEDSDDYNTGADLRLNPSSVQLRQNNVMVADFTSNSAHFMGGIVGLEGSTQQGGALKAFSMLCKPSNNAVSALSAVAKDGDASNTNIQLLAEIGNINTIFTVSPNLRPTVQFSGGALHEVAFTEDIPDAPERLPYCKAVRTASATTSATAAAIADLAMQSLEMNYSGFSILGGAVIVPKTGRIKIHGAIHYSSYSSSVARGCYLKRNGAEVCGSYSYGTNAAETDAFIDVNAGDTISIASRASSASQGIDYKSGAGYTNTYLFVEYMDVV